MCGLIGFFSKAAPIDLDEKVRQALEALKHRGPDDVGLEQFAQPYGTLVLGHTRLSIIDLSPGGHQPMRSADGRFLIVFNGEIYNYRELRSELQGNGQCFRTDSDTEVLLCAWAIWGTGCLRRLIGMFAFAVWDRLSGTVTLVRDAFGIKPLFYAQSATGFVFASEMAALLALCNEAPQVNPQRAYDYLVHGVQDSGSETFLQGVYHVPPAHWLRVELRQEAAPVRERWWNPSIAETSTLSFGAAAETLRELFLESVRLHLRSDVALGVALSGGVDSAAIACAMRHVDPGMKLHSFSFVAAESALSEERWIDLVNSHTRAIPHKIVVNPVELGADIDDLVRAQGEPFCSTSMYAQYRVFQAAEEAGITVILEGQGGDELLAGYAGFQGQRMRSLLECCAWPGMLRFARQWKRWPGREQVSAWRGLIGQLVPDALFGALQTLAGVETVPRWMNKAALKRLKVSTRLPRFPRRPEAKGRRVAEALLHAMSDGKLVSLLRYGDRNAMRFSIENRVPFLTLPLAEFVLSLPEHYLIAESGQTKSVLRAAMRGIVPDAVLDRRDKVGFETPMEEWVRGPVLKQILPDATGVSGGVLHNAKLDGHLKTWTSGHASLSAQDWRLINLLLWMSLTHATTK